MAKTADRKVEIAPRIQRDRLRRARPRPRGADLRRAHVHADHRRRGVAPVGGRDDRGHPPDQGRDPGREDLARRLQRVLRRLAAGRARSSTRSSCTTASRPGSTWRWSTPTTSRPTPRSPRRSASSPTTSSSTAATTRSSASSPTSSPRARRPRRGRPTRPRAWSPRRPCTGRSCAARRRGRGLDRPVGREDRRRPHAQQVLLPAMKEVGDKFGAGELILPFVLQSAEVMKRAVAQLENYLERIEGHTKGKVVIATVFGDVHDIGKSLVNTILTNNGYTVVDLGKQVPIDTIIDAAIEHEADAIGLSALLVSTSKQMPLCVQELHERGLEFPVLIGGAAINRDFGRRSAVPEGQGVRRGLRARASSTARTPSRGLDTMDAARRRGARATRSSRRSARRRASCARSRRVVDDAAADHRRQRALGRAHRRADPRAALLGRARDRRSTSTRSTPTSTATCCSSCTGAAAARRARSGGGS